MKLLYALICGLTLLACSRSGAPEDAGPHIVDVLAQIAAGPPVTSGHSAERPWCGDDYCDNFIPKPAHNAKANSDTRSRADIEAAACGWPAHWWCGNKPKPQAFMAGPGSSPIIPNSWTVSAWAFDPANSSGCASDQNTCTQTTCGAGGAGPCSTWGEIWVHRLGAGSPQLQQVTTFTQMSSQTLNVDPIFGTFQLQNGKQAILIGTLSQVCTIPINTATVTGQVRGNPGTRWAVSNACVGEASKELIQDTTANTWATIETVAAGTATITQPLSNALVSTVGIPSLGEASMSTNDAFTVWAQPLSNLKAWRGTGGDVGVGGAGSSACAVWAQNLEIADSSGTGASEYPLIADGALAVASNCRMDGRLHVSALDGRGSAGYTLDCDVTGLTSIYAAANQTPAIFGGIARLGIAVGGGAPQIDGDIVVHSQMFLTGGASPLIGSVFTDTTAQARNANFRCTNATGAGTPCAMWGSGAITLSGKSFYLNASGTTFALSLFLSPIQFGDSSTITTGFTPPNCGTFTNNGVTQVDTTPAAGHWPAGATFSWSLNTVGGTACGSGGPYFSAAVTQDNLFTKAVTVNCNDVYNYCAMPTSISMTAANLDTFGSLTDPNTGASYSAAR